MSEGASGVTAGFSAPESREADLQQRLVALVAAASTLFGSPKLADVMPAIVVLARTLIAADGYGVWRHDAESNTWHIGGSHGVSERFIERIVDLHGDSRVASMPFNDPLVAEQVDKVPILEERLDAYREEGIASVFAVPLKISGRATGTLVFYYRARHAFTEVEIHTGRALGAMCAAAIASAELYEEQRRTREQAERASRQTMLLAQASAALASSLDYEATLRTVANLAVPQMADWCAVDVVDEQGATRRLAVAHIDPAKIELARSYRDRYPENPETPGAITNVIRTGEPIMVSEITDAMLVQAARDEGHLGTLRRLGVRSYICAPMVVHARTIGAITFVSAESGRRYTDGDFQFAQDLAYRSALAVENARAYRQANVANRMKDEFLATLSHELRTPLNAVLGWTRMLRTGSVTGEKMTRAFEIIERNAIAQLDLVEDLLDLSRIIRGKLRLEVRPVRIAVAIDAAVEAVQPAATAKAIAVDVRGADTDIVKGDSARLQQAIWNLLSNAIKFTPRGGKVNVTVSRRDDQVEVAVSDTGEGIDSTVLPFVFDRFRQGDSGTTRAHTGLGLGLAIVRHIVELHGGNVDVTSPGKGQGSTFRLLLPVASGEPAAVAATDGQEIAARPRVNPALQGIRAIVVDDDRDARDLVCELLRTRGVQVASVASGTECLTQLDREVPDIIISDIAMPGVDGYDMMARVRERAPERGGRVPAIALTAYARREDSERSLSSGFQAHLSKPVHVDDLLTTIASLTLRATT